MSVGRDGRGHPAPQTAPQAATGASRSGTSGRAVSGKQVVRRHFRWARDGLKEVGLCVRTRDEDHRWSLLRTQEWLRFRENADRELARTKTM